MLNLRRKNRLLVYPPLPNASPLKLETCPSRCFSKKYFISLNHSLLYRSFDPFVLSRAGAAHFDASYHALAQTGAQKAGMHFEEALCFV